MRLARIARRERTGSHLAGITKGERSGWYERTSNCSVLFLLRAQYHKSLLGAPPLPRNRTLQEMAEYIFQETSGMPLEVGMHSSTMLNSQFECLQSCARSIKAHCTAARDLGSILFRTIAKPFRLGLIGTFKVTRRKSYACKNKARPDSCTQKEDCFNSETWKIVKPWLAGFGIST